jgi:hypothetical protein
VAADLVPDRRSGRLDLGREGELETVGGHRVSPLCSK